MHQTLSPARRGSFPGAVGSALISISGTSGALWSCPWLSLNPVLAEGLPNPPRLFGVRAAPCNHWENPPCSSAPPSVPPGIPTG